jgi:ribosomal protein L28
VAGGKWKHRAPKTLRVLLPNLHKYQGKRYCTKCLRLVKQSALKEKPAPEKPAQKVKTNSAKSS